MLVLVTERTLAAGWTRLIAVGSQEQDQRESAVISDGKREGMSEGMNERDENKSGSERERESEGESEKGDREQQTEDRDGVRPRHEQRSVFDLACIKVPTAPTHRAILQTNTKDPDSTPLLLIPSLCSWRTDTLCKHHPTDDSNRHESQGHRSRR